jgi:hypothetical protein
MSYKLDKPYTDTERADFVCLHQGMTPVETHEALYFLESYEELQGSEIVDISVTTNYITSVKTQKLAALQTEYDAYITKLGQDWAVANAQGNTTVVTDIASEMADVLLQYTADKAEINGEV